MDASSVLILPGWQNSGPAHWQSLWEAQYGYLRVEQHDWMRPLRGDWVARLEEVLLERTVLAQGDTLPGVVLAAHSLGCMLVAAWAKHSRHSALVRGALLVAPGDPQRESLRAVLSSWSPIVMQPLPFRSTLVASHNDPYCSFERASEFAAAWGSGLVDCGDCGHVNADSGLGLWPQGHRLLRDLCPPPIA
jgi:predicted alpha/beta hydrolase family esterase